MRLSDFRVLTFDCYGTLIDWERGLLAALDSLLVHVDPRPADEAVLERFAVIESQQQLESPTMKYSDLLAMVHARLGREFDVATSEAEDQRFGASVGDWPAFPDSVEALGYLKQHFALVILSNVDRASFRRTNELLGVTFDVVITAEDIGSYKPDPRNFEFLLARLAERSLAKRDILHTAQSLYHDHVPANALGLASCWIDRHAGRPGATVKAPAGVHYDFRFPTLAAMAAAYQAELAGT
jgi:2-haloalkanoic acid dehalogenase type II